MSLSAKQFTFETRINHLEALYRAYEKLNNDEDIALSLSQIDPKDAKVIEIQASVLAEQAVKEGVSNSLSGRVQPIEHPRALELRAIRQTIDVLRAQATRLSQSLIKTVPADVKVSILSFLPKQEIPVCASISKEWRQILSDSANWEEFFKPDYPGQPLLSPHMLRTVYIKRQLFLQGEGHNVTVTTLEDHKGAVFYLKQDTDGRLFTASRDGTIKIWKEIDGAWTCRQTLTVSCSDLQVMDGKLFVAYGDTIKIWKEEGEGKWKCVETLPVRLSYLQVTSSGKCLAAYGGNKVQIWKEEQGKWVCLDTLPKTESSLYVQLAESGKRLCMYRGGGKTVEIWDERDGRWVQAAAFQLLEQEDVSCLRLASNGRVFAGIMEGGYLVFEEREGVWKRVDYSIEFTKKQTSSVNVVAEEGTFPEGTFLTGNSQGQIQIWNRRKGWGKVDGVYLHGHTMTVHSMQLNAQGVLFTASQDGTIKIWNLFASKEAVFLEIAKAFLLTRELDDANSVVPSIGQDILMRRFNALPSKYSDLIYLEVHKLAPPISDKQKNMDALKYGKAVFCDRRFTFRDRRFTNKERAQAISNYLKTVSWSVAEIAQEFARTPDWDSSSREFLLEQCAKLPQEKMWSAYEALYRLHNPQNSVWRYGELAFHNQQGFSSTNQERSQALLNSLQKTVREEQKEEKKSGPLSENG